MPFYEFGPFVLDTREKVLWRDGQQVPLKPKGYRVLLALVERSGCIIEKDYFMREVWDGSLRQESNLPQQVSVLRKTLGELDAADGEKYIETVATRGYKFIATVRAVTSRPGNGKAIQAPPGEQLESPPAEHAPAPRASESMIMQRRTAIRVSRKDSAPSLAMDAGVAPPVTAITNPRRRLGLRAKLLALAVIGFVVAATLLLFWPQPIAVPPPTGQSAANNPLPATGGIKTIAVVPFRPRGEISGLSYLELGLPEAIAMKLGGLNSLIVRPMSAVEREMRSSGDDHLATGRALKVDAILEGSFQQFGDELRVTAQLLRVSDGKQLWSGRFDEGASQVFHIQDAISEQLVSALQLNLAGGERDRLAKRHTQNPEAYRLYLLGRFFWRSDQAKSKSYYQQALDADPSYALAHAGLADTYAFGGTRTLDLAEKHAREALRLDENLAEPHATLGFLQMFSRWEWAEAEKELKRALELNPNYATAHQWYAIYHACRGRTSEAVARMQQAVELDPLSPAINADLGQMYFFARDYNQALAACRRALELDPNNSFAMLYLFYLHAKAGREAEAAEAYLKFTEKVDPAGSTVRHSGYKEGGFAGLLREDIDHFINVSRDPRSYNRVAEDYALLGDQEQALKWLQKSVESQNFFMAFINVNPLFDNVRAEPRFAELVQRVGLTP